MDAKSAVEAYSFGERVKAQLIVGSKLVDRLGQMGHEEARGGKQMTEFYLQMLLVDVRIADNATRDIGFKKVESHLMEAIGMVAGSQYDEAIVSMTQALSGTTTICARAAEVLLENKLM